MRPVDPRLLRAVPEARGSIAALATVGVLQGISTITLAFGLTDLVVAVVQGDALGTPAALLAAAFAARALLGWLTETISARAGVAVSSAIRRRAISGWVGRPSEQRPADATTMATQGAFAVEPYVARFLPALVVATVVPVLAVIALVLIDPLSALVVLLTVPLLPLFAALIGQATRDETDRRWRAMSDLSGHFVDVLRGLPTLVSYGRAERQVETIGEVSGRHRAATMKTLRTAFLSSAALELFASISVALVAVVVGLRLTAGDLDLRAGLLAILLAPEAYWPIRRVGQEFHNAADGAAALDRLLEESSLGTADSARTGRARIELDRVSYAYPGADHPVLDDVGLRAGLGLTVVTGPSGAGKTTLLELVAGLREPTSGRLRTSAAHLVSQRPFLVAGSVRANLGLGNDAADDQLWGALRDVGLEGFVAGLPRSLDTLIGDDGFGLSAGQRARLAIARALLSRADVILLDEPTAHLDAGAANAVHDSILRLARRRIVLVVTHRPELVALADHCVQLAGAGVRR